MYHRRSEDNGCAHSKISGLASNTTLSREEKKSAALKSFRVDEDEFTTTIQRVISVVCLNEYFKYAFSKDLLEAKPKELQALKLDLGRYEEWRPTSKKVKFGHLVAAIDFVSSNLK